MNRVHAITSKNQIITSFFGLITISQFILGLYVVVDAARRGCEPTTKCTHDSCLPHCFSVTGPTDPTSGLYDVRLRGTVVRGNYIYRHVSRIRYGSSLVAIDHLGDTHSDHPADVLAFSVVVFLVARSKATKVPIPSLLKIMVQDATYYFLVIFTSHIVLVMFLAFASVSLS